MNVSAHADLPVAIIGAGPVGLAAAAHLARRGQRFRIFEAGTAVGANLLSWGHVRVFTPWRHCLDGAAATLLRRHGWREPDGDHFPTAREIVSDYLAPLAGLPEIAPSLETGARVTSVSRLGLDKVVSRGRDERPFALRVATRSGERTELARAVIDASGTWTSPNPLGADGLPATGEDRYRDRIAYGIPDVLHRDRTLYAGRSTLVVGAGHSAANVLLDLARLTDEEPRTSATWAVRGSDLARVYGGGAGDQLPARAELGSDLRLLVESGRVGLVAGFAAGRIEEEDDKLAVHGATPEGPRRLGPFDRIVVATGQRPDHAIARELRIELDPLLESSRTLGPLIDPNLHSCGTVPPHGHRELAHPESGYYVAGVKSYGRAPTFLMLTGYEQVRSIAAALAGDMSDADDVRLVLPETGVCVTRSGLGAAAGAGCCGGPAPTMADACCAADESAKRKGATGCGCRAAA